MASSLSTSETGTAGNEVVELKDAGHAPLDNRVNVADMLKEPTNPPEFGLGEACVFSSPPLKAGLSPNAAFFDIMGGFPFNHSQKNGTHD